MNLIQEAFAVSNHLSHRWPQGEPRPIHYHYTSDRRPRRLGKALLVVSLCLVAAAALVFGGYLGMVHLANSLADAQRGSFAPRPSSHVEVNANWDPADLPWAQPDPNVSIFVHDQDTQVLTSNQIYDQVRPAVVCVTADQGNGSASVGSGVVLTQSGYIVTNFHIIQGGVSLNISMLSSTANYDAKLVGYDEELDLAVLKIEAQGLVPARLGSSDQLSVGDSVYAIGNPMGYLHGTMTEGIISSPTRTIQVDGKDMNLLQTSAALNSGNSGGPLINCYGQVIGINTMKIGAFTDKAGVEGLGFAIPSTTVKTIVDQLISQGYVSGRPTLGISGEGLSSFYQHYYRMPAGLYITQVAQSSEAYEKGVEEGDLLLSINDTPVTSMDDLKSTIFSCEVGQTVQVAIYRGGQQYLLELTLEEDRG